MLRDRHPHLHAPRALFALLWLGTALACAGGSQPAYEVHTLTSGRQVKVLGEGRVNFEQSGPALMLRYQTDIPLADTVALQAEAADIWRDYESHADNAGVRGAVLSANIPPGGGLISRGGGYTFLYEKGPDGHWHTAH